MSTGLTLSQAAICIVTALPKELAAVRLVFSPGDRVVGISNTTYYLSSVPCLNGQIVVAIVILPGMGNTLSAAQTTHILRDCENITDVIMIGIAGAIPCPSDVNKHVRLGDIVVSGLHGVFQFDIGKYAPNKTFEYRSISMRPSPSLWNAINQIKGMEELGEYPWELHIRRVIEQNPQWSRPASNTDVLDDGNGIIPHPALPSKVEGAPRLFIGVIASSNAVLKEAEKRNAIVTAISNVGQWPYCVEMEGAGIQDAAWLGRAGYLIVRGTCDYCNATKNDIWQKYAALIAAAFARSVIESLPIPSSSSIIPHPPVVPSQPKQPFGKIIDINGSNITVLNIKNAENAFFIFGGMTTLEPHNLASSGAMHVVNIAQLATTEKKSELKNEVDKLIQKVRELMYAWNYEQAEINAEKLEYLLIDNDKNLDAEIIRAGILLIARVYINMAEYCHPKKDIYTKKAKKLLDLINEYGSIYNSSEILALRASLENAQNGPVSATSLLPRQTDPYTIRVRIALLLNQQKFIEAMTVVETLECHERWCDVAVMAYALNNEFGKACELVQWSSTLPNKSIHIQCCVRLAESMLSRVIADHPKGENLLPQTITEDNREKLSKIIEVLNPLLQPILVAEKPSSGLDIAGLKIAWKVNHLLKKRDNVAKYLELMSQWTPLPLDVARGTISGYIKATPDLLDRLIKDHPNDLDAGILAAVIESDYFGRHKEAFVKAKDLLIIADTDDKKESLFELIQQLWQKLEEPEITECETLAKSLINHKPLFATIFEASIALRHGNTDQAIQILDGHKAEEDLYWLRVRANACLQKQQLAEAIDFILPVARKTLDSAVLATTGDIAYKTGKYDISAWCYERLSEIRPDEIQIRVNLAHIYTSVIYDLDKATMQFRILHNIDPTNDRYTYNLAICLAKLFLPEESLVLYEELCHKEQPLLAAVIERSELYNSIGNKCKAMESLREFRDHFWDDPSFVLAYMNTAYAAGEDNFANDAMTKMVRLKEGGTVNEEMFRSFPKDDFLDFFKQSIKITQERNEFLNIEILKGHMPWITAEQVSKNAIYLGWRSRTQELDWLGDDPTNLTHFCIYSSNGFNTRISERGKRELLPIECPPAGTRIVADISALITLHRLNLLDLAAEYFGEIIVPEGYLPTVLEDSRLMVVTQKSRQDNAEKIKSKIDSGHISLFSEIEDEKPKAPTVDEYTDSDEHLYRLIDIVKPIYSLGIISEVDYARISQAFTNTSSLDDAHPVLQRFQKLIVRLSTLETIAQFGLLDFVTGFYKVYITREESSQVNKGLNAIGYQEETRNWHMDLWGHLRRNPRFKFMPHSVPDEMRSKDDNNNDNLPFISCFISQKSRMPLLADDRVCQMFMFNGTPDFQYPAFGTDVLASGLMNNGKLEETRVADVFQQLITWRYRFIVPPSNILKAIADPYRNNLPGHSLRKTSEYVHDCMRDLGLFGGAEKSDLGESMATRTYLAWISSIAEFLVLAWADENISEQSAIILTTWSCNEFLPSLPRVVPDQGKVKVGETSSRLFLSHIMLNMANYNESKYENRMVKAMETLKNALKLNDDEYLKITTEVLCDMTTYHKPDSGEKNIVFKKMQERIRNYALQHFKHVNPRSFILLQDLDLFDDDGISPIGSDIDPEIFSTPNHKCRLPLLDGPLFLYKKADDDSSLVVVDIYLLLFSSIPKIRTVVFDYFDRMISENVFDVTPKTKMAFENNSRKLLSLVSQEWRPAAIELTDAITDDVLIALQGTKQILESGQTIKQCLSYYLPRTIHPPISSLDSIRLEINNPEAEHSRLLEIITEIVAKAPTLKDACTEYYARLGYLPLAPAYSMAEVVVRWTKSHPGTDTWTEVWSWMHGARGPSSRYHACSIFVLNPDLIPEGKHSDLWVEIIGIIRHLAKENIEPLEYAPWTLRRNLVRHYAHHLESRLPGNNSAKIANFAWWLTERVVSIFPDESRAAKFYNENWVRPATDTSSHVWLVASSRSENSFLRYITASIDSPWATAMMALMGINLERLAVPQQAETQELFFNALVPCLIGALPIADKQPIDPTYAQEYPLAETARKWGLLKTGDQQALLEQIMTTSQKLSSSEGLCAAISKLSERSFADQLAITFALKSKAYTDPTIAPHIWDVLSDAEWRQRVLGSVDISVLDQLIASFSLLQVNNGDKWFYLFPHYIAELCEKTTDDERQRLLFLFVIHASLGADNVSAVRRLLRGDQKTKFIEQTEKYREGLKAMWPNYPPWVQGRLRSLFANLYVE